MDKSRHELIPPEEEYRAPKRQIVGYTAGVFDLFHIGHLNILRNAKALCDFLIVGITTDDLMLKYKNRNTFIPFVERMEIVRHIDCVDAVVPQDDMDKFGAWEKMKFDIMFVGDDWYNTPKWQEIETKLKAVGVRIVYFPYTKTISSSKLNAALEKLRTQ